MEFSGQEKMLKKKVMTIDVVDVQVPSKTALDNLGVVNIVRTIHCIIKSSIVRICIILLLSTTNV